MKTYNTVELVEIIEKHGKWLDGEEGGERADLHGADLHGADLHGADLHGADLREANLSWANLRGADLREANLHGADLHGADLREADLREANLSWADLRGADLREANLHGANLHGANLSWADLREADLREANLSWADLHDIASFWGCSGNRSEVKAVQADTWDVTYTASHLQIGCQLHLISEWWEFGDDEIARMDDKALEWWSVWKPILQNIIEVSPAVPGKVEDSK